MHDRQPSLVAQTAVKNSVVAKRQYCFTKLSSQVAQKLAMAIPWARAKFAANTCCKLYAATNQQLCILQQHIL